MEAPETIADAIEQNALGPKAASGDSGSVEQHSIQEQIAADRYVASKQAMTRAHRGLRFNKIVPPGGSS